MSHCFSFQRIVNTQVFPLNKAAFIKINKCTRFSTKVFAAPLCSYQHILYRGSRGRRAYAVLVTELLLVGDEDEEDGGMKGTGRAVHRGKRHWHQRLASAQ